MASTQPTPNPQAILQCLQSPGIPFYYSELAQDFVIGSGPSTAFGVQAVRKKLLPLIAANFNNLNPNDAGPWLCDDARKWDVLLLKIRPLITISLHEELRMKDQGEVVEELKGDSEATLHRKARQCLPQLVALYNANKWPHRMPVSVVPRGTQLLPPHLQHLDSAIFRRLTYESGDTKVLAMIDGTSRAVSRNQTPVFEDARGDFFKRGGAEFVEPMDPVEAWQLALNLAVFGVLHSMPLPYIRRDDAEALAREVARIIAACAPVGRAEALRVVQLTSDNELAPRTVGGWHKQKRRHQPPCLVSGGQILGGGGFHHPPSPDWGRQAESLGATLGVSQQRTSGDNSPLAGVPRLHPSR